MTKGIIASGDSKLSRLDSLGLKPEPLLLRSTEARDTRTSDGEAETARDNGTGRSTEGDSRGDNHDENERSTENEDENAFLNTVAEKLEQLKRVSFVTGVLRRRDRNNSLDRIVLDRRGRGAIKLVGASDDVVVTYDTGTGQIDFHFKEYNEDNYNIGDDLSECSKKWPQLDRTCFLYKKRIREMSDSLTIAMELVRKKV